MLAVVEPVKSRREEYAEATRAALIAEGAAAFADKGFAKTSLDEVAARARVTKGALYHHFSGKRGLFEAILDVYEQEATDKVFAAAARYPDDPWQGALAAIDVLLEACAGPVYGRLVFIEGPIGLGWARWREFENKYAYRHVELLGRGLVAAGVYPEDTPIEATTRVAVGMLTHAGIALAETPPSEKPRVQKELAAVLQRFFAGLRADRQ